jgi:hypothetical protein
MMKPFFLIVIALGISFSVFAQDEKPIIVVATQGPIVYKSPKGVAQAILGAGAVLQSKGSINLVKNSSVTLLSDGRFLKVTGEKKSTLAALFPESDGLVTLNFEQDFSEYVNAAISMAANPENPKDAWGGVTGKKGTGDGWGGVTGKKGTGDGWGGVTGKKGTGDGWGGVTGKKGTGDGWGGKGNTLNAISPLGHISLANLVFTWSKPAGAQSFEVEIKNSGEQSIFKMTTKDTFLLVKLDPTIFIEGNQYQWQVSTTGAQPIKSSPLVFEISTALDKANATKDAESTDLYKNGSKVVQETMRAVALEQAEWFAEADQIYRGLKKIEPNNTLLKLMHSALWMRLGLKPVATKAFK